MASVGVKPSIFKNYKIKIGADNYEAAVSSFKFTPSGGIQTWKGGTPAAVFTDVVNPTWTCDLKVAQDWETTGSLAQYLLANQGKTVAVEFFPLATGPKFAASITLTAPEIGGDIDAWGESTVQCAVQGQPSFTAGTVTA